jgi:hypothetical protein
MTQCDYLHEAWGPHEGCKEFMDEPETFRCQNPAAMVHTTVTEGPDFPDYKWTKWVENLAACEEHPVDFEEFSGYFGAPTLLYSLPLNGDEF